VVLVVFGIAVAIVANAMRVALIGILLYLGVSHDTHGPGHVLQGMSVATAGYVALFLGAWALSRLGPAAPGASRATDIPSPGAAPRSHPIRTAATLSIALIAVFAWEGTMRQTPVPLPRPLSELPRQLGGWSGGEGAADAIPIVLIPGSDRLTRVYESPARLRVNVLVLYVPDQSGNRELVGYRTTPLLLGGAGVTLRPRDRAPVEVRRLETVEGERTVVTFAWYDVGGHVTGSPWRAKVQTAWNVLSRGTSGAALVVIRAEYPRGDARDREPSIRAFAERLLESLRSVLPGGRPTAA
jgi:EpsI family protein